VCRASPPSFFYYQHTCQKEKYVRNPKSVGAFHRRPFNGFLYVVNTLWYAEHFCESRADFSLIYNDAMAEDQLTADETLRLSAGLKTLAAKKGITPNA